MYFLPFYFVSFIAFIIFALAGLGIRHYIKGKGSCGDCECSCPVKEEMHKANR